MTDAPERILIAPNEEEVDWGTLRVGDEVFWEGVSSHRPYEFEGMVEYVRVFSPRHPRQAGGKGMKIDLRYPFIVLLPFLLWVWVDAFFGFVGIEFTSDEQAFAGLLVFVSACFVAAGIILESKPWTFHIGKPRDKEDDE